MPKVNQTLNDALQGVVGRPLESVDFVEDYVQLRWDRSSVTAFTKPKVIQGGVEYESASPGYRDLMYGLEGQILLSANVVLGEDVNFSFSRGLLLRISVRDEDCRGPEAIHFRKADNSLWVG